MSSANEVQSGDGEGLGDYISSALATVGITDGSVSEWLGKPCGCEERRRKLNQLSNWAVRVMRGKTTLAREFLERIMS